MPTPGWRGLCNATRRIRTNGAKLEQGLGKGHGCEAMKAPVGLSSGSAVLRKQDGGALPRQALAPTRMTEWTAIFQALKICGHRSILAFTLSVQH